MRLQSKWVFTKWVHKMGVQNGYITVYSRRENFKFAVSYSNIHICYNGMMRLLKLSNPEAKVEF